MTRILYWNIGNFSLPKIRQLFPPAAAAEAADRLNYIVTNVLRGPAGGVPDLIIVVEVFSRIREVGVEGTVLDPARTAGGAVLELLAQIRADPVLSVGTNWCVVPPLNLGAWGQREAVAVFYNATVLQFTGPNLFYQLYGPPGNVVGQSQPVNAATHAAMIPYPAQWTNAMPALARTTAFMIGGVATNIAENQLAGEWQYYVGARAIPSPPPPGDHPAFRIAFPNNDCRGPFLTRFLDLAAGAGGRSLNIFSIHTSPPSAGPAVFALQTVPEIAAVPANQVNVLLGDFNVDTFGPDGGFYDPLIAGVGVNGIYRLALDPRSGHAGAVVPARQPYCMTHLLPTDDATPYNASGRPAPDAQHNVYPRYGYMGGSWPVLNQSGAIDNVLTAYGAGAAAPAENITVVNTITGTPYNAFLPAPAGVTAELTGGAPFPSSLPAPNMLTTVPPATAGIGGCIDDGSAFAVFSEAAFQLWNHVGKIRSTSDHLPLMIDV